MVETFERLAQAPNAGSDTGFLWVFISTLLGYAFSILAQWALASLLNTNSRETLGASLPLSSYPLLLLCGAPFGAVCAVIGLMISAGITQLIAGMLGGTGTYSKLVYVLAAYLAPLTLVLSILSSIPVIKCLTFPIGIYAIALNVMAIKAVNQFGWGKALASSVLIYIGILLIIAVTVIIILALLGPAIGNVFSNIIKEIGTPRP